MSNFFQNVCFDLCDGSHELVKMKLFKIEPQSTTKYSKGKYTMSVSNAATKINFKR